MTCRNLHYRQPERQSGLALLELMLTLGIVAITLGAIASIGLQQSASAAAKTQGRTIEQAIEDLRLMLIRQESFASLNLAASINLEVWPSNKVQGGGVFSEWGSPIGLSIANGIDPNQDVLRVDVPDVPQNACAQLATYDFTNNRLAVNGNVAYNITSAGGTISPINVATVTANCSNPLNDISIWFGKDN